MRIEERKGFVLLDKITARSKERYRERLQTIKKKWIVHGKEEWNVFGSGVREHFAQSSPWTTFHGIDNYDEQSIRAEMNQRRDTLHKQGKKMLIVEHFGQGRAGMEFGADKVITSGLTEYSGIPPEDQVVGDAMEEDNEKKLKAKIINAKNNNHSLQMVIFRPVGGMSVNSLNLYAFRTFYAQLRTAYELLDEDGILLIGSFGLGTDIALLTTMLEASGCHNLIMSGSNKSAMGIRKTSSIRSSLPTEIEWARAQPDILQKLIQLDTQDARTHTSPPRIRVPARREN